MSRTFLLFPQLGTLSASLVITLFTPSTLDAREGTKTEDRASSHQGTKTTLPDTQNSESYCLDCQGGQGQIASPWFSVKFLRERLWDEVRTQ